MAFGERDAVVRELPPWGVTVEAAEVVRRSGLPALRAWLELAKLCCEGVVSVVNGRAQRGAWDASVTTRRRVA